MKLADFEGQVLILAPLQLLSQLLVLLDALLLECLECALYGYQRFLLLRVDDVGLLLGDMRLLDELERPLVFVLKELYVLELVDQLALHRCDLTFWLSAY